MWDKVMNVNQAFICEQPVVNVFPGGRIGNGYV